MTLTPQDWRKLRYPIVGLGAALVAARRRRDHPLLAYHGLPRQAERADRRQARERRCGIVKRRACQVSRPLGYGRSLWDPDPRIETRHRLGSVAHDVCGPHVVSIGRSRLPRALP